jgi:hypothetical protein
LAKKNVASIENAINLFEEAMTRSSLSDYFHVNRTLLAKNNKDQSILIKVEQELWNAIIDKSSFKEHLTELDVSNPEHQDSIKLCSYSDDITNESWIDLNCEELYAGKVLKLTVDDLEYDLSVNKALIPLKLKKSEFTNITYRIFPDRTLALKKYFNYPIDNCGFSIIRIFQIV